MAAPTGMVRGLVLELRRGGLVATALVCAMALSGCQDVHEQSCVWHSDLNIKGCAYFGFRSCIEACTYCIRETGPDECGQLKCAASCAKQDGDASCLSNYKALCEIALEEQDSLSRCDVDCSRAPRSAAAPGLLALLAPVAGALFVASGGGAGGAERASGPRVSTLLLVAGLVAMAVGLQGCCDDPEHQLSWEPDFSKLRERADWYDENGIWRGVPDWQFSPNHEAEEYVCKQVHATRGTCVVWSTFEFNCEEEAFGICQCYELAPEGEGDYCQAWGCHALEADQEVCSIDGEGNSDSCRHEPFPMNEEVYYYLMERSSKGVMTTGEEVTGWYMGTSWFGGSNSNSEWPPSQAYSSTYRTNYFSWDDVCIVNGDNKVLARRQCSRSREIETEISHCHCKRGSGLSCLAWHCEERDVGQFSALFRTRQNIDAYAEGTELEEYECLRQSGGPGSACLAWEGTISSPEEVEMTQCECSSDDCRVVGAVWKCDEYDLPRTRDFNFPKYRQERWPLFIIPELFVMLFLCFGCWTGTEPDVALYITIGSSIISVLILPFLVVTLGPLGLVVLGMPCWALRVCCCGAACLMEKRQGGDVRKMVPDIPIGKGFRGLQ